MGVTLEELEKCFNEIVNEEAEYVAVQIEMDGFPSDEVIINDKHNIDSKLAYYKKTYNEDLGFWCKKSIRLGHTDITTLEKVCDQYEKGKFVQMEALSA